MHNGHYAEQCDTCHTTGDWQTTHFDHDLYTHYPLTGRHRNALCEACHLKSPYAKKPADTCNGCHQNDDVHKGRNGTDCKGCHSTSGWGEVDFDHSEDTAFPLRGRHGELVCTACHRTDSMDAFEQSTCVSCHRANDIHRGEQGEDCAACHNQKSFKEPVIQ